VDQAGVVLDVLVQRRRNKQAAKRLLRKLLKRQMRPPRVMITDKLASYGAANREIMPGIEHRQHKGLNNRAENSHQPTRQRERQMKQFKSMPDNPTKRSCLHEYCLAKRGSPAPLAILYNERGVAVCVKFSKLVMVTG
jgi:transposase-like protein